MTRPKPKPRAAADAAPPYYQFTLVLSLLPEESETDADEMMDIADALFEAGCDDGTFGVCCGVPEIGFAREAPSLREAILSAIRDVERAGVGLVVERVEPYESVTPGEVARRIGRTREEVRLFASGRRGLGGFPPPAPESRGKPPRYRWTDVARWWARNSGQSLPAAADAATIAAINAALELRLQGYDSAAVTRLWEEMRAAPVAQATGRRPRRGRAG